MPPKKGDLLVPTEAALDGRKWPERFALVFIRDQGQGLYEVALAKIAESGSGDDCTIARIKGRKGRVRAYISSGHDLSVREDSVQRCEDRSIEPLTALTKGRDALITRTDSSMWKEGFKALRAKGWIQGE